MRKLKVHQPVVTNVRQKVRAAANRQLATVPGSVDTIHSLFCATPGRRIQKIQDRLLDFDSPVGIRNQIHIRGSVLEYTPLKNRRLRLVATTNPLPLGEREKNVFTP